MDKINVQDNLKNVTRVRYSFLIAVFLITLFIIWTRFYHLSIRKSNEMLAVDIKNMENSYNTEIQVRKKRNKNVSETINSDFIRNSTMKTILIWTLKGRDPLMFLLRNQYAFINRNCKVKSCYITTDKHYMGDVSNFDVVLFNGPEVVVKRNPKLPHSRSPRQKYVFASIESSDYYPICDNRFDGYFNVSWTYKLNSDIFYGYIIVRNIKGEVIGPQKEMQWISIHEMQPINDTVKQKLSSKKKLAAWLVSNCHVTSRREQFVKKVQMELKKIGTDMTVDIYGKCGTIPCERHKMPYCLKKIESDYFFYFSFENSFSEDYVTEKVLHPLQHYTVPVVYGTANYTRFMPDGIYLNAIELGPENLAKKMVEIANDTEKYYNYFKWMNHYSFHYVEEVPETDSYCKFCEAMNDESLMNTNTVIHNFKKWWNPPKIRRGACPARRF